MYHVYIVRCADNSLYCGQTSDLERRIKQHNSASVRAARYTKSRRPVVLVYSEQYSSLSEALKREAAVKKLSKQKKEALVSGNSTPA
jgi:predicted GIY-YIG superfamily endonuclease